MFMKRLKIILNIFFNFIMINVIYLQSHLDIINNYIAINFLHTLQRAQIDNSSNMFLAFVKYYLSKYNYEIYKYMSILSYCRYIKIK